MDVDVLYFQRVKPDLDFMNEVFSYDVRTLNSTDTVKISQYCIALSQFLVYMKSEIGKTKQEINMKQRFIDSTVNMLLTKELLKEHKTKTATIDYIISESPECQSTLKEINERKDQITLLEGQDKSITELINAFKREMTRRENELQSTNLGRR